MIEKTHTYDWLEINENTICLCFSPNIMAVIKNDHNQFHLFQYVMHKGFSDISYVESTTAILDLINEVHSKVNRAGSYINKDSSWKSEPATAAQLQYCWGAKTKWDVHIHFLKYNLVKDFEKYILYEHQLTWKEALN